MKKAKKRLIITSLLITILIVAFLFSGCSNVSKYAKSKSEKASGESAVVEYTCVSKPKSEKKIYVILKNYHGDYWKTVIEGIERAAKEIDAGVYLGGIDNETDIDGQISLMEKAVKEGADGILLAPANSNSLADSCEKVRKKKIPVVLIDSSINSTEFDVCYMTDNIDAGEMAAKEMLTMLHDAGNSPQEPISGWNLVVVRCFTGDGKSGFGILRLLGKIRTNKMGDYKRYCFKWRGCGKSRVGCSEIIEEK